MPLAYEPKFPQPFTLKQAIDLDVSIITNEIARLTNSIAHLKQSNAEVQEFMQDPENKDDIDGLEDVTKENEQVIEVEEDRIQLLKHALEEKIGTDPANKHYDIAIGNPSAPAAPQTANTPAQLVQPQANDSTAPLDTPTSAEHGSNPAPTSPHDPNDDEGLFL